MDALSSKFAALADPTRRAILARLVRGETSVTELAEPFAMSMPAISKHLKVLEHAGLVTRGRAAQWRPCRIEPAALREVDDWLEDYRRFWEAGLDRLEMYLGTFEAQDNAPSPRKASKPKATKPKTARRAPPKSSKG